MVKDIAIFDTHCVLNEIIQKVFQDNGLEAVIIKEEVSDESLKQTFGFKAICLFVNEKIEVHQVDILKNNGIRMVLCCSAGFDNVPVKECTAAGIKVARVRSYSPASIAEYAIASFFCLARHMQKSFVNTKQTNFSIDGMEGTLIQNKTCGIIGCGIIGKTLAEKMTHLVSKVLLFDAYPDNKWLSSKNFTNVSYAPLDEVIAQSHLITLHVPLLPSTKHLVNREAINKMKDNVIIVNTSRGEVINTTALLEGLKSKRIQGAVLDVFEGDKKFVYKKSLHDNFQGYPHIEELSKLDNVILSSHVAFYTDEAVQEIANTTLANFKHILNNDEIEDLNPK